MLTHTVRAVERDRVVEAGEAGGAARHREEVRQYVQSMFDAGQCVPSGAS